MPEYLILKTEDLKCITDELLLIRKEIAALHKTPAAKNVLNVDDICAYMGWSRTTFERMQRHPVLPLPTYKMGGVKVNFSDLEQWKNKYQELHKQGKI